MYIRRCDKNGCRSGTTTENEYAIGLCDWHQNRIKDDSYYGVVCWRCGNFSLIQKSPDYLTEKFIFRDGCKSCNNERDGKWLTISKAPATLTVNINGKLADVTGEQVYCPFPQRMRAESLEDLEDVEVSKLTPHSGNIVELDDPETPNTV